MWEWQWQKPADHGTRYDFGIIETHKSILDRFDEHNEREPSSGWVASILQLFAGLDDRLPPRTQLVDQRRWTLLEGRRIGGRGETGRWELTRGGIAACWAIETSGTGATVVLVGCDNLRAGMALPVLEAFSSAYMTAPATASFHDYVEDVSKTGNHDFPAERKLIQLMAASRGVNIHFAQDLWTGP